MTRKTIVTVLLMMVSLFNIASSFAQDPNRLMLVTNEFPPYASFKDGQFSGIAVDIITKLMSQAGYPGKIIILPWKRALQYSQNQKMMLFPYTRRPYREKSFKWIGPILNDRFVFAVRSSDKRIFSNIDDFKNLQIGVNESTPTAFRLHELAFEKLQIVTSEKFNAKKLVAGNRIDAWYAPYLILKYTIQFEKIAEKEIRIAFLDIGVDMYIAASLSVPDETIALWQKNLDEMKENGTYQLILSKSIYKPR
ncbi:transporter substrate-binding domain-containing protein [uncultured Desulfosarcina sp.]|uniref:substrate-binding periplasmic protein n=1 Tax=uncultured Desulfosarcina sp. TaxID=218289 RepID=UPI0029C799E0|nr:transporter substrate-binding domain-containing protein [uncultured Desulfosarcina sp.]